MAKIWNKGYYDYGRYTVAKNNGYVILNTATMQKAWNYKMASHQSNFSEYQRQSGRAGAQITTFLQMVQRKQQQYILQWIRYWVNKGVIQYPKDISGNTIADIYTIIRSLQNKNAIDFTQQDWETKDDYEDRISEQIKKMRYEKYDLYDNIRTAILNLHERGQLFIKNSLQLDAIAVEAIAQQTCNVIAQRMIADSVVAERIANQRKRRRRLSQQLIASKINNYYGPQLRKLLAASEGQYEVKKDKNGKLSLRGKNGESLLRVKLQGDNSGQIDGLFRQSVVAAFAAALGGQHGKNSIQGAHTGAQQTRHVATINIQQDTNGNWNKGEITNKYVSGKDDATWTINTSDTTGIKIHFSSKLYGVRKDQKNGRAVKGIKNLQLQDGGSFSLRSQELQHLLQDMDNTLYEKIRFGINNLANQSLIRAQQPYEQSYYEQLLAQCFAAFMFNATFDELTKTIPDKGRGYKNIYIFDVNGGYYTLAEMCEMMLIRMASNDLSQAKSVVKVNITPADTNIIKDRTEGKLQISSGIQDPPFSEDDWVMVRQIIQSQTKISAVTVDMTKMYNPFS